MKIIRVLCTIIVPIVADYVQPQYTCTNLCTVEQCGKTPRPPFCLGPNACEPCTLRVPTYCPYNCSPCPRMASHQVKSYTLFPNPATVSFTITGNFEETDLQLSIINTIGQTIYFSKKYHSENINISNLLPGIYFVFLSNNKMFKLIKT